MKRFLMIAVLLALAYTASAQQMIYHTMKHQGLDREYYLYVPDSLDANRPLVVMLHGFGGNAKGYMPEMAAAARRHGFALCVPQGWPTPLKGQRGWNVRYPAQEGQTSDDVAFVMYLVSRLQNDYGLNRSATFLTGMSNGGEMCYVFAWQHPETFTAIASVAGLTMAWVPAETPFPQKPVPFMEIHGTEDHVSEWAGDPEGQFGWGPYIGVQRAVDNIATFNRCTHEAVSELPLKSEGAHKVILHRYLGGTEVRLYEVVGGGHSWALNDLDTVEEIWGFFSDSLK